MNEVAPVAADAPKKRRSGWWFLAKLVGVLVLLGIGSIALWLWSDRDLRAVKARMTAAGFATTVAELKRVKSSPERCAQWTRLQWLLSYKNPTRLYTSGASSPLSSAPGHEVTPELIQYHADLPPSLVAECDALIDGLGDDAVVLNPDKALAFRGYALEEYLFQRVLVVPPSQLEPALRRLFRQTCWARVGDGDSKWGILTNRPARALLYRSKDLSPSARTEFADALRAVLDHPEKFAAEMQASDLLWELAALTPPDTRFLQFLKERGSPMMALMEWDVTRLFYLRAGRAGFLERELEQAVLFRDHRGDLHALQARRSPPTMARSAIVFRPADVVAYHMKWDDGSFLYRIAQTKLLNDLVAAVLTDQPWPVDWFDPTGARLRPIVRDGVTVGAYSVGRNAVDDGGTYGKDVLWALFGPIGP